jgi:hypothetical protein
MVVKDLLERKSRKEVNRKEKVGQNEDLEEDK